MKGPTFKKRTPVYHLMHANMLYLITTPSCSYCPRAKQILDENAYRYEMVDASKPVGLNMAKRFSVQKVPTLLVTNKYGELLRKLNGIEEIAKNISTL